MGWLVDNDVIEAPKDGNHGEKHPTSDEYVEKGIPFLMASDIHNGRVDLENCKYITKERAKRLDKGFAREGDVLLTHKATIGEVAILEGLQEEYAMLTPQVTYYRILDNKRLSHKYLYAVFHSESFQNEMQTKAAQSTRPYIGISAQQNLTISLPCSTKEQQRIGEYFASLDTFITLHQRKLKLQFFSLCLMIIYRVSVFLGVIFMGFAKEVDFEAAMIEALSRHGWEHEVLRYPTEDELIDNWARILFENNRDIDRLNDCPLIREEMNELLEQLRELRSPLAINSFINGRTVAITRKNPADTLHYGKEVSLKIYDRHEIAAGQSRYQIAQQPIFARKSHVLPDRRGDLMLLINGMPVFHIELKNPECLLVRHAIKLLNILTKDYLRGFFSDTDFCCYESRGGDLLCQSRA